MAIKFGVLDLALAAPFIVVMVLGAFFNFLPGLWFAALVVVCGGGLAFSLHRQGRAQQKDARLREQSSASFVAELNEEQRRADEKQRRKQREKDLRRRKRQATADAVGSDGDAAGDKADADAGADAGADADARADARPDPGADHARAHLRCHTPKSTL